MACCGRCSDCAAGSGIGLGRTTEQLAEKTGAAIGGLLNVTFSNAAEMIIGLTALRHGLGGVVKASNTGAVIGNLLLVLGAALLAGGLRHPIQTINASAARSRTTMLLLAATALIAPAAYHHLAWDPPAGREDGFSLEVSIVLMISYGLGLVFSLRTHRELFAGHTAEVGAAEEEGEEGRAAAAPLRQVQAVRAPGPDRVKFPETG
jgi:Ca2+:H+ antiporter